MEFIKAFFLNIEFWLIGLSNSMSVELFSTVGAFVEEIIAPIPSPLVMTLAGTMTQASGHSIFYIFYVGFIGSIVKTFAQWLFYIVADKTEDIATSRLGKYVGFTHESIEKLGKYFNGGIKDELIIIAARALPILPSAVVSVGCGFIKTDLKTFLRASLIGNYLRSLLFLYIGYTGFASYEKMNEGVNTFENIAQLVLLAVAVLIVVGALIARKKFR